MHFQDDPPCNRQGDKGDRNTCCHPLYKRYRHSCVGIKFIECKQIDGTANRSRECSDHCGNRHGYHEGATGAFFIIRILIELQKTERYAHEYSASRYAGDKA